MSDKVIHRKETTIYTKPDIFVLQHFVPDSNLIFLLLYDNELLLCHDKPEHAVLKIFEYKMVYDLRICDCFKKFLSQVIASTV